MATWAGMLAIVLGAASALGDGVEVDPAEILPIDPSRLLPAEPIQESPPGEPPPSPESSGPGGDDGGDSDPPGETGDPTNSNNLPAGDEGGNGTSPQPQQGGNAPGDARSEHTPTGEPENGAGGTTLPRVLNDVLDAIDDSEEDPRGEAGGTSPPPVPGGRIDGRFLTPLAVTAALSGIVAVGVAAVARLR
ncbi:MAG TPA: hypothetical protein VM681_10125 [Candidatus Thermoplasmatota archaeon]|nr:hypothetical protein [Candidatus Thermoplasmatota archaeon]